MGPRPTLVAPAMAFALASLVGAAAPRAQVESAGTATDTAAPNSMSAVRTATPPAVDGRLDDPAWILAPAFDRFTQFFPDEGMAPSERTEVRVLYDDSSLYVLVRMDDAEPDRIVTRPTRRDRDIETDWVAIHIDSRHDHTTAFVFQLSAAGVQRDGLLIDDGEFTDTWDAVWAGATSRDAGGWSAEFRIPLSVLRFAPVEMQTWGFQVVRRISRRQEEDRWAFVPSTVRGTVSRFGHLHGLMALRPRRTFELRPFVVARLITRNPGGGFLLAGDGDAEGETEGGLDLKLGLTPRMTLDATINPDFGQVEVDEAVLNLTRFETEYPEKRPFFLEGMDVFDTPLFYSRRIGEPTFTIDAPVVDDGEVLEVERRPTAVQIVSAAKVSGQVTSDLSLGLLGAVTGPEVLDVRDSAGRVREVEVTPIRSYGMLRGRYEFGGATYAGLVATAVSRLGGDLYLARSNHGAYVEGVDGQWQSADGVWRASALSALSQRVGGTSHQTPYGAACRDPAADPTCVPITRQDGTRLEPGDVGHALVVDGSAQGPHWGASVEAQRVSPTFDINDAGFDPDGFNRQLVIAGASYRETRPRGPLQNYRAVVDGQIDLTIDRVVKEWGNEVRWESQTRGFLSLAAAAGWSYPEQWDVVETGDGARFEQRPALDGSAQLVTDSRRAVVLDASVEGAVDLDGEQYEAAAATSVRLQLHEQVELAASVAGGVTPRDLRFYACTDDGGAACTIDTDRRSYLFARLDSAFASLTARGTYTVSPALSLQGFVQLFGARLRYSGYREIVTDGPEPSIRFADMTVSDFDGDLDGDGSKDDDSTESALNANLVLRWEFSPGATVLAVYTRAQTYDRSALGVFRIGDIPAEDVLLLKLTLFYG